MAFVSVYRPPGKLGGIAGNLVHRYGRLYHFGEALLIHAKFYDALARWLESLSANGFEVLIGGDWNADLNRDRHFNSGNAACSDGAGESAHTLCEGKSGSVLFICISFRLDTGASC